MAQRAPVSLPEPPVGAGHGGDPAAIRVRGTRDGLLLAVPEDVRAHGPGQVAAALAAHLAGAADFFSGAEVIVDLGLRQVGEEEIAAYRRVLEERGVIVRGFTAASPQGRELLRKEGYHPLHVVPAERTPPPTAPTAPPASGFPADVGEALYVRRTLRSGARLRHHGHLVIVGDVNPGAEVAASGDILVWGVVRGTIHAGALGDDAAIICALALTPTQLRIGGHYTLPPAALPKRATRPPSPERARLEQGRLIVEPWNVR